MHSMIARFDARCSLAIAGRLEQRCVLLDDEFCLLHYVSEVGLWLSKFIMDPLSILISTFTLCDGTLKVLKAFEIVRNAPEEIQTLVDDIAGLKAVIKVVTSNAQNPQCRYSLHDGQLSGLDTAVINVNTRLQKLGDTVNYCAQRRRCARLFRNLEKIKAQRQALNDAKLNLLVALAAINL